YFARGGKGFGDLGQRFERVAQRQVRDNVGVGEKRVRMQKAERAGLDGAAEVEGTFLERIGHVGDDHLADGFLAGTVEDEAEGAFGLVLNRSSEKTIGEMVVADMPDALKECPLYLGGPVQTSALSFLHSDTFLSDANVIPNLALGHSLETLTEIAESFSATRKVKMFAGYSGWGPGQLEGEMARDAWLTFPASLELILDTEPATLWQKVLHAMGPKYKLLAQMPEDLSLN